jgi:hypothetical protein
MKYNYNVTLNGVCESCKNIGDGIITKMLFGNDMVYIHTYFKERRNNFKQDK